MRLVFIFYNSIFGVLNFFSFYSYIFVKLRKAFVFHWEKVSLSLMPTKRSLVLRRKNETQLLKMLKMYSPKEKKFLLSASVPKVA